MKKILVPTDFSDNALLAYESALDLAGSLRAELHLLHVIVKYPSWKELTETELERLPVTTSDRERGTEKRLQHLKELAAGSGVTVKTAYCRGVVMEEIEQYAEKEKINLILIGCYGTSGIRENILGSNCLKMIRVSQCPLLLVKSRITIPFKRIVFASNFNKEAIRAFKQVAAIGRLFEAEIFLVNIDTPAFYSSPALLVKDSMEKCRDLYLKDKCYIHQPKDGNIGRGIDAFVKKTGADLLALGTYGRKWLPRLFMGSISEALCISLDIPVLSINLKNK